MGDIEISYLEIERITVENSAHLPMRFTNVTTTLKLVNATLSDLLTFTEPSALSNHVCGSQMSITPSTFDSTEINLGALIDLTDVCDLPTDWLSADLTGFKICTQDANHYSGNPVIINCPTLDN